MGPFQRKARREMVELNGSACGMGGCRVQSVNTQQQEQPCQPGVASRAGRCAVFFSNSLHATFLQSGAKMCCATWPGSLPDFHCIERLCTMAAPTKTAKLPVMRIVCTVTGGTGS